MYYDYWFAVDNVRVSGIKPEEKGRILTIEVVGVEVQLTWNSFGDGTYYVDYTTDLTSGVWQEVAGPITETTLTTAIPDDPAGYVRIRSAAP